jgi:hypothetical protein
MYEVEVNEILTFVVALIGQINNVVGALGWGSVAIYLLLALGYGYLQFAMPER